MKLGVIHTDKRSNGTIVIAKWGFFGDTRYFYRNKGVIYWREKRGWGVIRDVTSFALHVALDKQEKSPKRTPLYGGGKR